MEVPAGRQKTHVRRYGKWTCLMVTVKPRFREVVFPTSKLDWVATRKFSTCRRHFQSQKGNWEARAAKIFWAELNVESTPFLLA